MNKYRLVEITKDDLRKMIYFILMKFRSDSLHMQGTSSKRDLVGGYIERWFNKIAETIIFDDLLKGKKYKVVADYFLYANDSDKNAPDILGIEKSDGGTIPFVKYNNGTWKTCEGMPRIEVKVVRNDQVLVGVREPQMIDDYYMFIESDLEGDYLSAIFEEGVFNKKYLDELKISPDFVESDDAKQLLPHSEMSRAEKVGSMRLIGIYTKEEIKNLMTLCAGNVKPYYFADAENIERTLTSSSKDKLSVYTGLCSYSFEGEVYLPFPVDGCDKSFRMIKKNKGSLYIELKEDCSFCGVQVKKGCVKISFKKFDRSSNWNENIALKQFLEAKGKDMTEDLIREFDKLAQS